MKKLIPLLLMISVISCDNGDEDYKLGCIYAYPSDGDPAIILGCSLYSESRNIAVGTGYDRIEWYPISDCDLCKRHDPRGKD
jgi:hypothetical protein